MIQVNLLPDVKATYVKAERTKRTVITLSALISIIAVGIVALLAGVAFGVQKLDLSNTQSDIDDYVAEIQSVEDLDKILTIQNQLNTIDSLYENRPAVGRLFQYLQQTTPSNVRIDTLSINFTESTMDISGNATNIETINKYVDTLKFTELRNGPATEGEDLPRAFSDVVLGSFSTGETETTYSVTFNFDPTLFESLSKGVAIQVPNIITTRSQTEAPGSEIFKLNEVQEEETQ